MLWAFYAMCGMEMCRETVIPRMLASSTGRLGSLRRSITLPRFAHLSANTRVTHDVA